jgi:hypothetical protein
MYVYGSIEGPSESKLSSNRCESSPVHSGNDIVCSVDVVWTEDKTREGVGAGMSSPSSVPSRNI